MERQIEQLYKPLFLFVKNRVDNQEDAEDLTQEVFYKVSKSGNAGIRNIKSWVYTIAKNTITDYYRKKEVITNEVEDMMYAEEYDTNDALSEMSQCIRKFINELPEEYRSLMTLSELEEVPQKEIAERLGMNYVTVRSKIQRGRKKLKNLFAECCVVTQGGKGSILTMRKKTDTDNSRECCD
ncbi:MAG: sigma-70 family RNA polymerase sigma factor [Bacteroidota bacterium]